jgi:hypothetical protein
MRPTQRGQRQSYRHDNGERLITPLEHITELRLLEAKYEEKLHNAEQKFQSERDRRYTEVKNAEEKALRIKEQADRDALQLAREIQVYKDEKANELRSQIERERGSYATQADLRAASEKIEATVKPIQEFVSAQRGATNKSSQYVVLAVVVINVLTFIITFLTLK